MPTLARSAISSSGASSPCSANTSRAAATIAARLRAASARSGLGSCTAAAVPGQTPVHQPARPG